MNSALPIDIISTLPDETLSHILSFLPTKLAISTSILSKRWVSLYKSLTFLRFNDESIDDEEAFFRFRQFVDKVTFCHPLINTFILECRSQFWDHYNVERWITRAKSHYVENFEICYLKSIDHTIPLTTSIFIFPTLVVLKLTSCLVDGNISFNLPFLKTLHLNQVYLENNEQFNKLVYGCPILEDLIADIFYIEEVEVVTIRTREFETLPKLITAEINSFDLSLRAISNVENLILKVIDSYFRKVPVFQNLICLDLDFHTCPHWNNVVKILQNCPNLKDLTIQKWEHESNEDLCTKWKDPSHVPMCISSYLRSCRLICQAFEDELRFATYILQNAPHLGVMHINITDKLDPYSKQALKEELNSCLVISTKCKLSITLY